MCQLSPQSRKVLNGSVSRCSCDKCCALSPSDPITIPPPPFPCTLYGGSPGLSVLSRTPAFSASCCVNGGSLMSAAGGRGRCDCRMSHFHRFLWTPISKSDHSTGFNMVILLCPGDCFQCHPGYLNIFYERLSPHTNLCHSPLFSWLKRLLRG